MGSVTVRGGGIEGAVGGAKPAIDVVAHGDAPRPDGDPFTLSGRVQHRRVRACVWKTVPRGFGRFALKHAPPTPEQAQDGLQPRPASADWQMCAGRPATPATFSTRAMPCSSTTSRLPVPGSAK